VIRWASLESPHVDEPGEQKDDAVRVAGVAGHSGTVLLVEDDEGYVQTVAAYLGNEWDVRVAYNVSQARALLSKQLDFVGMIIDLGLPDGTGFDVLAAAARHHPDTERVILSGNLSAQLIDRAATLRALYLSKEDTSGARQGVGAPRSRTHAHANGTRDHRTLLALWVSSPSSRHPGHQGDDGEDSHSLASPEAAARIA
jgi:CheY-like chemotaxis protein